MENMEIWKDVSGYEGIYMISSLGRVKSLGREILNIKRKSFFNEEKYLKGAINYDGYVQVSLYKDKKQKKYPIHKLVAVTFLNHIPCGFKKVINHINLNKVDNRLINLEIVTNRENCNKKHIASKSKYVGVGWDSRDEKWTSRIQINGKRLSLGYFNNEIDAHNAYNKALCGL